MTLKACILAEQSVPRYTSYPTAPHFNASIGGYTYAAWLDALDPTTSLSLYLHVPYCAELCRYCGCNTKVVRRQEPVDAYAALLAREIALLDAHVAGRRVAAIHWGGGTPSTLGPAHLGALRERIDAVFDCGGVSEHAIELDPRHIAPDLVEGLARIGINRASFGVQEFSARVQEAIGRIQPYETVAAGAALLRAAGIAAINFDLMYGLPYQTLADLDATIAQAVTLRPSRIALFGYAHVPWFKTHQRLIDTEALPGASERLAQAEAARAALIARGYVPIGFDHFALPEDSMAQAAASGSLRRNFQGYTTDGADALLGLGASAIGRLPQGYAQNAPDVRGYARAIEAGTFATVKGIAFTDDDRLRARIIERLMCDFTVDLDALAPGETFSDAFAALAPLAEDQLVTLQGRRINVTEDGRPFVRLVASAFDAYLGRGAARHSRAV
jgi:oxygen-independent coproporphyrinogen-3 oxidase